MIDVMDDVRTNEFVMTIDVEPSHPAYDDPEWAADAAARALTDAYGLEAFYSHIESGQPTGTLRVSLGGPVTGARSCGFTITFDAGADHPSFGDPEWAADAAHGALTTEYGLEAGYRNVRRVANQQHGQTPDPRTAVAGPHGRWT